MKWVRLDARRKARLATALWVVLAVVVWNVVFDVEIIAAGRRFLDLARLYQAGRGPAVRINDIMLPAQAHALRVATMAAGALLAVGLSLVRWARSRQVAGSTG